MRQWQARAVAGAGGAALEGMIRELGGPGFAGAVLDEAQALIPAASWSAYRTGRRCRPALFLSASRGVPDRTRDCWWAYLSGPYLHDRSFGGLPPAPERMPRLCHVTAQEIPADHRARVYEPHGMLERVSVVDVQDSEVFAVNFYRHAHQAAFTDAQIASFEMVAMPLLALARKHVDLSGGPRGLPGAGAAPILRDEKLASTLPAGRLRERLLELHGDLTAREADVCVRLLQGMTQDGIAADLDLSPTTVKTYRNRAFQRLGIHFRNELFARVLGSA